MNKRTFFIAGIGTGVGKTVASAILCEAWGAHYWKPVQSGDLSASDSMCVKSLISRKGITIFPEAYRLTQSLSPHASALIDGILIEKEKLLIPDFSGSLIIEGAGGVMVPLSKDLLYIEMLQHWQPEIILVSRNYLGSINHTLLTAQVLSNHGLPVKGIIFNGAENRDTESVILKQTGYTFLGRIDETKQINREFIVQQSKKFVEWVI